MQVSTYRCFLPDLTGFADLHCIGPESPGIHDDQIFSTGLLSWEFSPARADCRYRAPLAPRLARPKAKMRLRLGISMLRASARLCVEL